jgi:hypothetical protein
MSKTPPEAMCDQVSECYISSPTTRMQFSWAVATELAKNFRIKAPKFPENIGVIKLLSGKGESSIKGMVGGKRNYALELSNIGKFPWNNDPSDKWKITRVVFRSAV